MRTVPGSVGCGDSVVASGRSEEYPANVGASLNLRFALVAGLARLIATGVAWLSGVDCGACGVNGFGAVRCRRLVH